MKKEYDLEKLESRPNPYSQRLKKSVTIRIDTEVIEFFKRMAEESGIAYQTLINFYLQDCMQQNRRIDVSWTENN